MSIFVPPCMKPCLMAVIRKAPPRSRGIFILMGAQSIMMVRLEFYDAMPSGLSVLPCFSHRQNDLLLLRRILMYRPDAFSSRSRPRARFPKASAGDTTRGAGRNG
jgi:hypothetical protein